MPVALGDAWCRTETASQSAERWTFRNHRQRAPALRVDGVLPDLLSPDVVDEDGLTQLEVIVWRDGGPGVHHQIRRAPQVPRDRSPAAWPPLGATARVHPWQVCR